VHRSGQVLTSFVLSTTLFFAQTARYRELLMVIDRNTGHAHMTRGVNMYTLYALRSCVSDRDIPVLKDLLRDKDKVTRMAAAFTLADMGVDGKKEVQGRISEVNDAREKLMLQEALETVARPGYRPILQYPLSEAERSRIRGCN
jgi:hypothetical protein